MTALRDWRVWIALLLSTVGVMVCNAADGEWWSAVGAFAVGFAIPLAYWAGLRSVSS